MRDYIKGKGILAGVFGEEDLKQKRDKSQVEKIMEETGYKYTNTEYVKKNGKITGLKIYVCSLGDMKI